MSDYAAATNPTTIRLERRLPGPIERVWSYIVDPEKRALWFCGGPASELRVGAPLTFTFDHTRLSHEPTPEEWKAFDGMSATGEITRYEPPRVFAYKGKWGENETEVVFELTPVGNEVLLALTHTKLADAQSKASYGSGWHAHLAMLEDRLNGVKPRGFWTLFSRLEKEYASRF